MLFYGSTWLAETILVLTNVHRPDQNNCLSLVTIGFPVMLLADVLTRLPAWSRQGQSYIVVWQYEWLQLPSLLKQLDILATIDTCNTY